MSKVKKTYYRGLKFEKMLEATNEYYEDEGICLVKKKPTPIQVLKTDKGRIVSAFYKGKSELDFSGVIKGGLHLDFDTKNTKSTTSFPFKIESEHQIVYMKDAEKFGSIAFYLINFENLKRMFILRYEDMVKYLKEYPNKKSIHFPYIEEQLKDNEVFRVNKDGVYFVDYIGTLEKLGMISL